MVEKGYGLLPMCSGMCDDRRCGFRDFGSTRESGNESHPTSLTVGGMRDSKGGFQGSRLETYRGKRGTSRDFRETRASCPMLASCFDASIECRGSVSTRETSERTREQAPTTRVCSEHWRGEQMGSNSSLALPTRKTTLSTMCGLL